jgi:transcriptional regulator with GAF, ATPase, and Fis domain
LEDLGSKNGSLVNGSQKRSVVLADGDWLQVGHTLLVFRAALPTRLNAPVDLVATLRVPALATLIPRLAAQLDKLSLAAVSAVPVLLISETGTGKELLARAVHALSGRVGDFVAVNCGGLPATLVESVLFGHKRGAFSGAVADQPGLFRAANGGTLLLDEVGDLPPPAQAVILRALQDGEVLPVGATQPTHVDVRVVAATHRDLEACVAAGTFREDLLARLSGFTFRLPSLRERREDMGLLIGALLRPVAQSQGYAPALSPEAGMALLRHPWPRNVRELEKCLSHAVALAGGGRIEVEHLPEGVRNGEIPARRSSDDELRERLLTLLRDNDGNVSLVAAALHTSRSQVHRWMKRFGMVADTFRR